VDLFPGHVIDNGIGRERWTLRITVQRPFPASWKLTRRRSARREGQLGSTARSEGLERLGEEADEAAALDDRRQEPQETLPLESSDA
jgi:hypothetical protein